MSRALVLLIGDSVTQQGLSTTHSGWGASLADYYSRFGDVINRGFSGYNSRWINEGYESLMLNDYSPSDSILSHKGVASDKYLCTLFLGANDASEDIGDGGKVGQGVGLEDYEKNINGILDKVAASIDASRGGVKPDRYNIVLITPGPCDHSKWPTRSDARVSQYASVIRSIGSSRNLPVVDLWSSDDGVPLLDASQDMWDGLHFNAGGNDKLFRKLQLAIRGNFPHLVPEDDEKGIPKMEMHGPYWGTMASVKVDDPGPSLVETWRWNK